MASEFQLHMSTSQPHMSTSQSHTPTSQPHMSTPQSHRSRHFVKLRSSCDACGAAKVRCSKEHPQCDRCFSMEIYCIYGQSRKYGKGLKWKLTDVGEDGHKTPQTWLQDSTPKSTSQFVIQSHRQADTSNNGAIIPAWTGDKASQRSSLNLHNGYRSFLKVTSGSPLFSEGDSTATPSSTHGIDHSETQLGNCVANDDFDFCHPFEIDLQGFPYATYVDSIGISQISAPAPEQPNKQAGQFPSATLKNPNKEHDCYRRAYATLETLHSSSQAPSYPVFMPDYAPAQALDNVLSCNKAAISEVLALLDCSCSQEPHLAMLYGSITSKILVSYQVAVGYKKPLSCGFGAKSSHMASYSSLSSPTKLQSGIVQAGKDPQVQSMGFLVAPIQITIGTFSIEAKDQEFLAKQLLLRELKKSGQLIDILTDHGANGGDAVDHLYSSLGIWLKSELAKTIKMLENQSDG